MLSFPLALVIPRHNPTSPSHYYDGGVDYSNYQNVACLYTGNSFYLFTAFC
jgi:hypothetical protein